MAEETGTNAKPGASTAEDQGPSKFHDQPIVVEGYLLLPNEAAQGEYRVRMFDNDSSFILNSLGRSEGMGPPVRPGAG